MRWFIQKTSIEMACKWLQKYNATFHPQAAQTFTSQPLPPSQGAAFQHASTYGSTPNPPATKGNSSNPKTAPTNTPATQKAKSHSSKTQGDPSHTPSRDQLPIPQLVFSMPPFALKRYWIANSLINRPFFKNVLDIQSEISRVNILNENTSPTKTWNWWCDLLMMF